MTSPRAMAHLSGRSWVVRICPLCAGRHSHGAGGPEDDPRDFLGARAAHCGRGSYVLVEAGQPPAAVETPKRATSRGARIRARCRAWQRAYYAAHPATDPDAPRQVPIVVANRSKRLYVEAVSVWPAGRLDCPMLEWNAPEGKPGLAPGRHLILGIAPEGFMGAGALLSNGEVFSALALLCTPLAGDLLTINPEEGA